MYGGLKGSGSQSEYSYRGTDSRTGNKVQIPGRNDHGGRSLTDGKIRIGMAKEAFNNRKELLTKRMRKALKKKIVKTIVWPVALYGCETWTLRKEEIDRLNAFEMWIWRRMERVSWKDH